LNAVERQLASGFCTGEWVMVYGVPALAQFASSLFHKRPLFPAVHTAGVNQQKLCGFLGLFFSLTKTKCALSATLLPFFKN
jgi:hypothetical protein